MLLEQYGDQNRVQALLRYKDARSEGSPSPEAKMPVSNVEANA